MASTAEALLPRDVYPLMKQMRDAFDAVMRILQEDEDRVRKGYMLLQDERDAMLRDIAIWHRQRPDSIIPASSEARQVPAPADKDGSHTPTRFGGPAERVQHSHSTSLYDDQVDTKSPSALSSPDRLHAELSQSSDSETEGERHAGVPLDRRTTETFGRSPSSKRARPSPPRFHRYRHSTAPPPEVRRADAERPATASHHIDARASAGDPFQRSNKLPSTRCPRQHLEQQAEETLHPHPEFPAPTHSYQVAKASARLTTGPARRSSPPLGVHAQVASIPATFWINVWPCFGTFSSTCRHPERVLVASHYRYMEDVTEVASKALSCQPAPLYLYEADGRLIRDVARLRPDHHYLLFPSGGRYNEDCVPIALLELLVGEARDTLLYEDPL